MTGRHVLIADDHPLTLVGLALAARAALPGIAVDSAASIGEAERVIAQRNTGYKLVLLDFVLPDARGFSGFLQLQHVLGNTPIVMVSAHRDRVIIEAAKALGAAGFLSKSLPLDEMSAALRRIAEGETIFPPSDTSSADAQSARDLISTLSGAQLKVMLALADGRMNKQIAGDLDITEATVKAHLTAIFRKLGVNNRAQALLAMQPLLGDAAAPS
ncbi:LuxR C-terminal-related transcriptional regulator [Sphingomonas immobilis]|uniref:Response regulator transcription factor n=1 Tax=Sphingomonas immobilis TaxID=3063997 RepID=A0ABT8ZX04_9SPHN|nr:response regulator transcription factor [Sphingomonas sp. CA1-15]MDO7841311.1 response regulator transcription factor [Sphingomonas sp. CA1-15]